MLFGIYIATKKLSIYKDETTACIQRVNRKSTQLFWHYKQYTKWHADVSKKMMEQVLNQVLLTESSATNGTLQGDIMYLACLS